MSRPKHVVPAVFALAAALAVASPAQDDGPDGCATMALAQRLHAAVPAGAAAGANRAALTAGAQASPLSARTLVTTHFAVHYTLAPNVHRVRLTATDASLKATADSIRAGLSVSLSTYKRDSTVHAVLDSLGAPHPLYVQRAAAFFERAWQYYDSLGMRMPQYASTSGTYVVPADPGRYAVDIADLNIAGGFSGPYYGVTYPPAYNGYILLENDFLYGASYDAQADTVAGSPVRALYPAGQVYHNYTTDWELGLKVTASHEFYHAVQYAYVSNLPANPHAWYELSATGMEERLAPEVNDYFQYLPYNIPNNATKSVLTPPSTINYGNGIFHTFLTHALGAGFDVPVWEALKNNGNQLAAALITAVGSQARWDSLYAAYAAALSISGTPGATSSPLAFSPDMALWPKPRFDTVPATAARQLSVPALTFRVIRPSASGPGVARLIDFEGGWRVDSIVGTGYRSVFFSGESLPVVTGTGIRASALVAANPSFGQDGQALLVKSGAGLVATTNPVSRSKAAVYFLASEGGSADTLRVVSESGRRVANLLPEATDAYWSWNLKDLQGRSVPPGLYFFGTHALASRPLVVQP